MDMTINTALSGLQTVSTRQAVVAHDVANINTPGFSQRDVIQTEQLPAGTTISAIRATPNPRTDQSNTDLAVEQVEQIKNKIEFKADLRVISAKDNMMQELLNLVA